MIIGRRAATEYARYPPVLPADMLIVIRQKLASAVLADLSGYLANCKLHRCGSDTVHRTMALNFINQSRSYDATLRAVRFWGHDGAMEVSFYVNADALKRIHPGLRPDEAEILIAFDANRDVIHMAAAKAYRRSRKSSYGLFAADF